MSILEINFKDESHLRTIEFLSKRNKFYQEEIKSDIYFINNQVDDNNNFIPCDSGYFIITDKASNKKKAIIGFILLCNMKEKNKIDVLGISFLLIDKRYRNNKFGSKLLEQAIIKADELNLFFVYTIFDKTDKRLINFYKKNNFHNPEILEKLGIIFDIGEKENKIGYNELFYISRSFLERYIRNHGYLEPYELIENKDILEGLCELKELNIKSLITMALMHRKRYLSLNKL